jgi:4'-phosphopantetheinyl transferase
MSTEASSLLGTRASSPALEVGAIRDIGWVLLDNKVHIWRVPLNQSSERTLRLLQVLSVDERAKAERFHFDKDRNQFVQARAALRFILSEYLNDSTNSFTNAPGSFANPRTLEFSYGLQGKPALANRYADSSLRFNLSRREGLALVAVTRGREIGVDVELVDTDLPVEIAESSFSEAELTTLRSLPESMRAAGFYNCWTRKEAYVKARGEGLSFPLKQFDVSLTPGAAAQLIHVRDSLDEVDRWTLQEVPVGEGYVAALAVEGTNLSVSFRDWDWSK